MISGFQLSAIFGKPSPAKVAAPPNPHRRPSAHHFPRVRSSEAFRRRPLYWVGRSRGAGIRNPNRKQSLERDFEQQIQGVDRLGPDRGEAAAGCTMLSPSARRRPDK